MYDTCPRNKAAPGTAAEVACLDIMHTSSLRPLHNHKHEHTSSTATRGLEKIGVCAEVLVILLPAAELLRAWLEVLARRAILLNFTRDSGRRNKKAMLMLKRRCCCTKELQQGSRVRRSFENPGIRDYRVAHTPRNRFISWGSSAGAVTPRSALHLPHRFTSLPSRLACL